MLSRQSGDRPNFHVFSEGLRKPLRPMIQDEVYRIGREALLNAACDDRRIKRQP